MAEKNSVNATLILRNDTAAHWSSINPVLEKGELGVENDTGLIKLGDGVNNYNDLDYINSNVAVDNLLVTYDSNGKITVANYGKEYWEYSAALGIDRKITVDADHAWPDLVELEVKNGTARWVKPAATYNKTRGSIVGLESITLTRDPLLSEQVTTKRYVDETIASEISKTDHLRRSIVTTLPTDPENNIIYMLKDTTATGDDKYKEYLLIDGVLTQIGDTSPDLDNYVKLPDQNNYKEGNLVTINNNGALVDTGIAASGILTGQATTTHMGGVLSSLLTNYVRVDTLGYMRLNKVSTDLLVNGDLDFVIDGGIA